MERNRLTAVIIEVANLSRSVALYRDGFGIDLHPGRDNQAGDDRWIGGAHAEISWRKGAYIHFALFQAKTTQASTVTQLGFQTEDIEVGHQRAVEAGAEVIHEPRPEPWGQTARYRDPDGNIVSLTQPPQ